MNPACIAVHYTPGVILSAYLARRISPIASCFQFAL